MNKITMFSCKQNITTSTTGKVIWETVCMTRNYWFKSNVVKVPIAWLSWSRLCITMRSRAPMRLNYRSMMWACLSARSKVIFNLPSKGLYCSYGCSCTMASPNKVFCEPEGVRRGRRWTKWRWRSTWLFRSGY